MQLETKDFTYNNKLVWRAIIVGAVTLVVALGVVLFSEEPTLPQWLFYLVVLAVVFSAIKVIRGFQKLASPSPAISISGDGIRDASWGRVPVPWEAILKIQEARVSGKLGSIIVFLDAEKMTWMPGPVHLKIANWLRGVRAGQSGKQIVLMMTPSVALTVGFDELLNAIERIASIAGTPIERATSTQRSAD